MEPKQTNFDQKALKSERFISAVDEWTTNISVKAKDADGGVLGSVNISGAPFKANRATEYSGNLFGSGGTLDVSVNEAWETALERTW